MKASQSYPKLANAIRYITEWHGPIENERSLRNLIFLADRLYWARTGKTYTEAQWTRANGGPYSREMLELEQESVTGPPKDIDPAYEACLDEASHKRHRDKVKDMIYNDAAYIEAQFGDKLLIPYELYRGGYLYADHKITFPHCDSRILHTKGTCKYCDESGLHAVRSTWKIACTGDEPTPGMTPCPSQQVRTLDQMHAWPGNRASKED